MCGNSKTNDAAGINKARQTLTQARHQNDSYTSQMPPLFQTSAGKEFKPLACGVKLELGRKGAEFLRAIPSVESEV
jgi:hypothetical protein